MSNKKIYSEEELKLHKQYSKETKKQAVWKNKLTQGFKKWKEGLQEQPTEEQEIEEAMEAVIEAEKLQETEMDEVEDKIDDIFSPEDLDEEMEEIEESESEVEIPIPEEAEEVVEKPKKAKGIDERKLNIFNHMNAGKWYSHRDFTELDLNGRQVRPKLVRLLNEAKVEKKTEHKRNYYKLI